MKSLLALEEPDNKDDQATNSQLKLFALAVKFCFESDLHAMFDEQHAVTGCLPRLVAVGVKCVFAHAACV